MLKFLIFRKLIAQSLFTLCIRAGNARIPKPAALRMGIVARPHCEHGVEKMLLALERPRPGAGLFRELERLNRQMCLLRTLSALTRHLSARPPYHTTKGPFNY